MKKFINNFTILLKIFSEFKSISIILFFIILLSSLIEGVGFALIMPLIDVIINTNRESGFSAILIQHLSTFISDEYILVAILGLFLSAVVFKNIFMILKTTFSTYFIQKSRIFWTSRIKKKYLFGNYSFIIDHKQGELLNNIITEPSLAATALKGIIDYIAQLILTIILISILLVTNWKMTVILVIVFGFIVVSISKISKNYSLRFGNKSIKLRQSINSQVSENLSSVKQIKLFNLENHFYNKLFISLKKLLKISIRFSIIKELPGTLGEILITFFIAISIILLNYFFHYDLKLLIPVIGVFVLIIQRLKGALSTLVSNRMKIFSKAPSLKVVYELSKTDTIIDTNQLTNDKYIINQDIKFNNLSFQYKKSGEIFRNLNLIIQKGKMTGIIGASGSGKSTIINLITGLHQYQKGQILINGVDLSKLDIEKWRRSIGVVSQEDMILNLSIKENIALGKLDASEDDIITAAKLAGAHDFIINLEQGYQTIVGDRGEKLSGGQRQRIAIARALIRDPELLIFDEATSALDNNTEQIIQKSIDNIRHGKTLLVIAHRLSTLENADIIFNLDDFKIRS
ncbi:MAG: ABC transporter ATP-binding protein/permease [Spirochaetes bacterium]|nr:ABC transporter ATP-binding protein/permease [Spirochaetota bacterium]